MSDDLLEYLSQLPQLEGYTEKDRFHDFRKTFTETPEGKRALRYILQRGCIFQEPKLMSPIDSHMLAAFRGKRQLALEILSFVNNEPPERPTKTTRIKNATQK